MKLLAISVLRILVRRCLLAVTMPSLGECKCLFQVLCAIPFTLAYLTFKAAAAAGLTSAKAITVRPVPTYCINCY